MKNKIALQLYSVREELQKDFYGTLKKVKEMGYSGVEFAGLYGHEPLEVKKMCEELGLVTLSAHVPFADLMNKMDETIACYKELGVKYVVVPYLTPEYRPGNEGFHTVIEVMKKLGAKLKEEGMVQQYHNHDFEFAKIDGEYALDILYKEIGPDLLQTQIDTCWVNVGGENPAEYVRKYAGRIPTVHLKDFVGRRSENMYALIGIDENEKKDTEGAFEFRPVGMGLQNFHPIVEAAIEGGATWFIVEQDQPCLGLSPLECAEKSVQYLLNKVFA